jgi:hypothetical protein
MRPKLAKLSALCWASAVPILMGSLGCSQTQEPQAPLGTVSLRLQIDGPAGPRAVEPAPLAPLALDSIVVCVYRPGAGTTPEACKGVGVSGGTGAVEVTLTCVAETGKRVTVALFETGILQYFGAQEGVDVTEGQSTDVTVDAYDAYVEDLTVNPAVVISGQGSDLEWSLTPAAVAYRVEESATDAFDDIVFETTTADTTLNVLRVAGAHYFRVAALTGYTVGSYSPSKVLYVAGPTELGPTIDAMDPVEAPPGERITLTGTNLDLPRSRVFLGLTECVVISATETQLVFEIPLEGSTGLVRLYSMLGNTQAPAALTVDRIAYVTNTGQYAAGYIARLTPDPQVSQDSGVCVVPTHELDSRDMSVFDIVVVAHDTGTDTSDWGGNLPGRAQAIASSGAQVLAIGAGGAAYLQLTNAVLAASQTSVTLRNDIYVLDGGSTMFQDPKPIAPPGPSLLQISVNAQFLLGFEIAAKPASLTLYASSSAGSGSYPLLDAVTTVSSNSVRSVFWGYTSDPTDLTVEADELLLNILSMLMAGKDAPAPAAAPEI